MRRREQPSWARHFEKALNQLISVRTRRPLRQPSLDIRDQQPDVLNPLTVGHVVLGFLAYRAELMEVPPPFAQRLLTREDFVQLEELQRRRDGREISAQRLAFGVESIIGECASRLAFVGFEFWGWRPVVRTQTGPVVLLDLSGSQLGRANALHHRRAQQIDALRTQTNADFRASLSRRQRRRLNDIQIERIARSMGGGRIDDCPFADRLAKSLELDGDQQGKLVVRCSFLRRAVKQVLHGSRAAFLEILDKEQRAELDDYEQGTGADQRQFDDAD